MEKAHHRLKRGTRRGSRLVARLYLSIYMFAHHAHHERTRGTVYTRTCPRLPRPPSPSPLRRATIAAISAPSTFPTDSTNDPSSSPKRYAFPVPRSSTTDLSVSPPRRHRENTSRNKVSSPSFLSYGYEYTTHPRFSIPMRRNFIAIFIHGI